MTRYDVFINQTGHFACNFNTTSNIQIGDDLDFIDRNENQYRGKVTARRFIGVYTPNNNGDAINLVQIDIDQEQPT